MTEARGRQGEVEIDLASAKTDRRELDGHLKTDFFDVAKFPKATFTSTRSRLVRQGSDPHHHRDARFARRAEDHLLPGRRPRPAATSEFTMTETAPASSTRAWPSTTMLSSSRSRRPRRRGDRPSAVSLRRARVLLPSGGARARPSFSILREGSPMPTPGRRSPCSPIAACSSNSNPTSPAPRPRRRAPGAGPRPRPRTGGSMTTTSSSGGWRLRAHAAARLSGVRAQR